MERECIILFVNNLFIMIVKNIIVAYNEIASNVCGFVVILFIVMFL